MSSILSLRTRMFRTRNPLRDANTDLDRLMTVRRSIEAAIDDASRERRGLQQRLDVYHAQATNLIDNSAEYATRDSEDEQSIREAEANGVAAAKRISQIDVQIASLGEMLAELDRTVGGNAN